MRYEQEILEKIMYYDTEGVMSSFPLYIYRLKEPVRQDALEAAVNLAVRCHPRFGCRVSEDAQGPYLETNPERPVIPELNPDEEYVFGGKINHHYPWIVGFRGREIIYTGWHGLADGMGATAFMRTVLVLYFRELGIPCDPGLTLTPESLTPEILEKDTECSVRKNGAEDRPSLFTPSALQPTVFPDELLAEDQQHCPIRQLAISLEDIRARSAAFEVSQFAVLATYIAQAICAALPGEDNVVLMNIIADMRGMLNSSTTHNCVMSVPVTFSQRDLKDKPDALVCTMFRSRLDLGFNQDEALHSCFNSAQMERQLGGSKEYLAGAAARISQQFGFSLPIASVTYTHLTHTGFSDDLYRLLDDIHISHAGYKKPGRRAILALNAVTTDRAVNLMIIDGTKGERIVRALENRLLEAHIPFTAHELERYKGVLYRRQD